MNPCESVAALLPLSAAGVLDAAEERKVREHTRECPACAARLETLGCISLGLASMPAPVPPADLAQRTQARIAAEWPAGADRKGGGVMALAGAAMAWISWFALWDAYRILSGGAGTILRPGRPSLLEWLAASTITALLTTPVAVALLRMRQREAGSIA